MKRNYFLVVSLVVVLGATAFFITPRAELESQTPSGGPTGTVQPAAATDVNSKPKHADLMTAGETVDVRSEGGLGDVVVAGSNVMISSEVDGYVMAAAANVSVDAPVSNDLWAAGASVAVNAPVGDTAMIAGSSVSIQKNATIGGTARIAGSSVDVLGKVTGDLNIAAANARLASDIGGNADIRAERVVVDPGAIIHGRLIVYSPNQPTVSPEAQVLGGVDYHQTESRSSPSLGSWLASWLIRFVWLSVLGLVAVWFSSVWVNRVSNALKQNPGRSVLTGLIALIAAPILCILLLVTVIGLPLGVVLGGMTIVALMLSAMFVSFFVGGWITSLLNQWQTSNVAKVLIGSLVVSIAIMLPWLGGLAKLVIVIFGLGAFLIERRDLFKTMRAQGLA